MSELEGRLRRAGCVFAEDEAAVLTETAVDAAELEEFTARRVGGEPLEQVLGWVEFAGLRIAVGPGVFVPRRRTELVARLAAEYTPATGSVVDLCCGVGAIAAAVAFARPDAVVIGSDIDPVAVAYASRTLARFHAKALVSDMDEGLPASLRHAVDVVTACPPYVPTDEIRLMPREAREHEPTIALDGGADGTVAQRRVFEAAARLLRPGGVVVVETSDHLVEATVTAARRVGLDGSVVRDNDLGALVVVARRVSD